MTASFQWAMAVGVDAVFEVSLESPPLAWGRPTVQPVRVRAVVNRIIASLAARILEAFSNRFYLRDFIFQILFQRGKIEEAR